MSGLLISHLREGFARAVSPISAGAISTPTDGLIAGEVAIPTGDGKIPGYRATNLAIAPDLYVRQGDVSQMTAIQEIRDKVVSRVPDSQVMSDLDSTANWAEKTGKGDLSRLAITGFCWGGRAVWLYAAHTNRVKAGAAWYGQLLHPTNEFQPKTPLDVAGSLKFPVLGLYGGKDAGIPLEQVEAMRHLAFPTTYNLPPQPCPSVTLTLYRNA